MLGRARECERMYPTSVEEDEETLRRQGLSYKQKCCLKQVVGEKKSLQLLLQMLRTSLKLLSCKTKEEAKAEYNLMTKAEPTIPYSAYIEDELFKLNWN